MASLIGEPVRRVEDRRLLTGAGRFTDDLSFPGQVHAAFVRSPHAHARIEAIETAAAKAVPGVLAVLTGRDYEADGLRGLNHFPNNADHLDPTKPAFTPGNLPHDLPPQVPLATGRVRHVGEAVALVVAETQAAAQEGAERVVPRYGHLPAVADIDAALRADAPVLWQAAGDNLFLRAENGERARVERAFEAAHRVVRLASRNQRVCPMPLEPRAAVALYDPPTGRYTLHSPSQGVHRHKNGIVGALGVPPDKVRVVTGDVGGGFGVRSPCYPEYPLLLWAARRVGRPVKWSSNSRGILPRRFSGARALRRGGACARRRWPLPRSQDRLSRQSRLASGILRRAGQPAAHGRRRL